VLRTAQAGLDTRGTSHGVSPGTRRRRQSRRGQGRRL